MIREADAERFARLAFECVQREYPNKIAHVLNSDFDVLPPRRLTPAFYGCYDWHSAVHGHWVLARLARLFPDTGFAADARAVLARNLTPQNIAAEIAYLNGGGRAAFERPYGLAWLLTLAAELRLSAPELAEILEPLEQCVVERFEQWLPKLAHPVRSGEHGNTAFALGLVMDAASMDASGRGELRSLVAARARDFYLADRDAPIAYEPSGEDFLSPSLAEADLMRRVLAREEFAGWLATFLPNFETLRLAISPDESDPKFSHLDGLNLSRAWMLEKIARGLPDDDLRRPALLALAEPHRDAGLAAVTGEYYAGGHWLGTFAVYLLTD
ncbi:MAG TPA: DUF2891 domain-containing protein [Bryobacteraceae bacterium]|nr:DUF2891 domain-containing protein [Bryobacteraceae bacterium]